MFKGLLNPEEFYSDSDSDSDEDTKSITNKTEKLNVDYVKSQKILNVSTVLPVDDDMIYEQSNKDYAINVASSPNDFSQHSSFVNKSSQKPNEKIVETNKQSSEKSMTITSTDYDSLHQELLQKQINKSLNSGDIETANILNNQLIKSDFKKKEKQIAIAKEFLNIREKRNQLKIKRKRKKLQWTFESKHRWETKSNM